MDGGKAKEIKRALQDHSIDKLKYQDGIKIKEIEFIDILTLINELGEENEIFLEGKTMWKRLHAEVCEENQRLIDRIADLGNKIEHGTLVELPCKVGDKVYVNEDTWKDGIFFNHTYIERKFFVIGKVTSVRITKNQILIRIKSNYQNNLYRYKTSNYPISAFGKTIFLTKAEAEKKLLELRGEV